MLSFLKCPGCHGTLIDEDQNEISGCFLFLKVQTDFRFQKSHFHKIKTNFKSVNCPNQNPFP